MSFVGTHRALLSSALPGWAEGFDAWYDYTVPRGTPLLGFPPATDTHSSSIYALTSSGNYQSFAANVPTRTNLGLQTVPTRTNLAVYSNDTTNANWSVTASSKTTGQADFIGGTGAALVTADGTSSSHSMSAAQTTGVSYTNGTTYTISRIVKPGTQTLLQLTGAFSAFGGSQYANFSLTGSGSVSASAGLTSSGVQALAGGWYRIWITLAATATVGTGGGVVGFISSGSDTRLPTNTLATNYTDFGAQVEAASFPSPLIVTAGTSATVNGNQQVIGLTGLLGSGVSGFVQLNQIAPAVSGYSARIFEINDGTGSNFIRLGDNSSGAMQTNITTGGVDQGSVTGALGSFAPGLLTVVFAFGPNYNKFRIVGGADTIADTTVSWPTVTQMGVGGRGFDTSRNNYQQDRKFALKFGPASQATFDAAYAAAQLAAASP